MTRIQARKADSIYITFKNEQPATITEESVQDGQTVKKSGEGS